MTGLSLIVLGAGFSRRFGDDDKLVAPFRGSTVLQETLNAYSALQFDARILIVNESDGPVSDIGRKSGFNISLNADADSGVGTSIAAGVRDAPQSHGVMIALGDMPFLASDTVAALIDAFDASDRTKITAPAMSGRRGHPVIFPAVCCDALTALRGDEGARAVISAHAALLQLISVKDPGIFEDIDTPENLPCESG